MNLTDPIQKRPGAAACLLTRSTTGLGGMALATLLNPDRAAAAAAASSHRCAPARGSLDARAPGDLFVPVGRTLAPRPLRSLSRASAR